MKMSVLKDLILGGEAVVTVGGKSGKGMADQIMAADKARLKSQLCILSKADMLAIEGLKRKFYFTWAAVCGKID
jgi:mRNA-degrading endonuclease toxin of MazEF toxin-antitoxin module